MSGTKQGNLAHRMKIGAAAGAAALAVFAFAAWLKSFPGGSPGQLSSLALDVFLLGLWLAWAGVGLACAVVVARTLNQRLRRRRLSAHLPLLTAGLATVLFGAFAFSGLPLRIRFELSERALRALATDARRGDFGFRGIRNVEGRDTGLYDVEHLRMGSGGSIVLITHSCFAADCGFAYSPAGPPPDVCADSNYQTYDRFTGDWYVATLADAGPCG